MALSATDREKLNEFLKFAEQLGCEIEGKRLPIMVYIVHPLFCLGDLADSHDNRSMFALLFESSVTGIVRIVVNSTLTKVVLSGKSDQMYYALTHRNKGTVPFNTVKLDDLKRRLTTVMKRIALTEQMEQKEAICNTEDTLRQLMST